MNYLPPLDITSRPSSANCSQDSGMGSPLLSSGASPRAEALRLQLVLDIDQTLLHAAEAPTGSEAQPPDGVHSFLLPKVNGAGTSRYHVRTRHGLHSFLRELKEFADVHIYTMASKSYTREVLNAIDPEIKLVAGRVFCREDGQPDSFLKSLTHLQSDKAVRRPQEFVLQREGEGFVEEGQAHLYDPHFSHLGGSALLPPSS